MKGLFLVYHGFADYSGISKKIHYQCDGLRQCGIETGLCYLDIAADGTQRRMVDDTPIREFGHGVQAKIVKRLSYADLIDYIRREQIGFLYIRHDHNSNPFTIGFLRRVQRMGVRIALEIPTYPYDAEFAQSSMKNKIKLFIDQLFRRRMMRYADRIVTFSDDTEIFGRPTIRISNGIDFARVPLKTELHDTSREVHLLAIANIHFWHGFDRAIEGLSAYCAAPHTRTIRLRIVGDGIESLIDSYRRQIADAGLASCAEVLGPQSGEKLDAQFAWCDMGIASLGRHRNGITNIKTLKNREYATRGIPFVYSEQDSDFDTKPYVMKAPADESPLDMTALLDFFDRVQLTPAQIRATVEPELSWKRQMQKVINELIEP